MLRRRWTLTRWLMPATLVAGVVASTSSAAPAAAARSRTVTKAVAFDRSAPLRDLVQRAHGAYRLGSLRERGAIPADTGHSPDGALQSKLPKAGPRIPSPLLTFEGLANTDNPFQVSPPDPNGEVGPNHFVEMVNIVFAVYSKTGTRLLGPAPLGDLWAGFAIDDCTDLSGDPVVLYDQFADRWILTQFTTRGPIYYNCVAVSQTGDPTGAYFRYAFSTGVNFPDYPKYGVWSNAYFVSTREFDPRNRFAGDGLYALERNKMIAGNPGARMIKFLLAPDRTPYLPGDGLLPPDIDGSRKPSPGSPGLFVGTMDDRAQYHAPFDGLNVFAFAVDWTPNPSSSFGLVAQLPVAPFDSVFPCKPTSRECIPQPGTDNRIDILSYRQRPTFRLAYRNFGTYESFVTNQSVEARPAVAGERWYEIRRAGGSISLYQQGTFAPDDGVNRWMGSIASDRLGDLAVGYSVSNATTVYPGIRYTGRLAGDPLGEMTLGEGVLIDGSGSQLVSHRWGDYTDMTVDPTDDCTFWYVNEYYQTSSARGWQTRIGSFRLPGC
jgi:hypothetical protein